MILTSEIENFQSKKSKIESCVNISALKKVNLKNDSLRFTVKTAISRTNSQHKGFGKKQSLFLRNG